jgi:hypothetical protein
MSKLVQYLVLLAFIIFVVACFSEGQVRANLVFAFMALTAVGTGMALAEIGRKR